MFPIIFIAILGLCIGSFLNVVIDRLGNDEQRESLGGRSRCDFCGRQLSWKDLIPVLSYVYLHGKCRYCKKKLSLYYPLVEILTSASFVFIYIFLSSPLPLLSSYPPYLRQLADPPLLLLSFLGIFSSLIVIFFADLKYHIIPDEATAALIIFAAILNFKFEILNQLVAGIALMLTIYFIFFVTRGRGMGFGDVKLAFAMGFLLGLSGGFIALYLAFVVGGICGLALLLLKKKGLRSKLAFGPFLVLGTVAMLFADKPISGFFSRLFGF